MKKLKLKKSIVSDLSKVSDMDKAKGGVIDSRICGETAYNTCWCTQGLPCQPSINDLCVKTEQPVCNTITR